MALPVRLDWETVMDEVAVQEGALIYVNDDPHVLGNTELLCY